MSDEQIKPQLIGQKQLAADPHKRELIKATGLTVGGVMLSLNTSTLVGAETDLGSNNIDAMEYKPSSEYVFSIIATISDALTVGETVTGQVRAIPITGGSVEAEGFSGIVVPGGADWQLTRKDGVTEIEATYAIQLNTENGKNTLVKVVNKGIVVPPTESGTKAYFRTRIMFSAPKGTFEWMNKAIFLCRAGLHPEIEGAVLVEVFKLV